jgi:hypothetical protein
MKNLPGPMPILRLAYVTLFLLALFTVFTMWSQVGGQGHLDLLPWHVKLVLSIGAAYAITRATSAAVAGDRGWNPQSVRWLGLALAILFICGMASYYAHAYLEDTGDEDDGSDEATISSFSRPYPDSVPPQRREDTEQTQRISIKLPERSPTSVSAPSALSGCEA